jgi:CRP/FNR family transcriptional regulator, cyclic AMP receptor protein
VIRSPPASDRIAQNAMQGCIWRVARGPSTSMSVHLTAPSAITPTRNSRIEEDLIDQLLNSSERRLARLLLLLANFGKEGSPQPISPNISQETLAEMIGTTRSRVSHFMNKFRKLGLISYNGHIEIHNSLLSAVLHEKPVLRERE